MTPTSSGGPRGSIAFAEPRRSRASGIGIKESAPHFIRDSPGRPVLQGADLFVQWQWADSPLRPDHVYLGLFDHKTDAFINPLHWGRAIPNTGSYAWHVDTHFRVRDFVGPKLDQRSMAITSYSVHCCYTFAERAGTARLSMPANIRAYLSLRNEKLVNWSILPCSRRSSNPYRLSLKLSANQMLSTS